MSERAVVPCGACSACCRGEAVILTDEDDAGQYETMPAMVEGVAYLVLAKRNGACVYLKEGRCSIHGRAPLMCRVFDCRKWLASMSRPEWRRLLREGKIDLDVVVAARSRMGTLTDEEREQAVAIGEARRAKAARAAGGRPPDQVGHLHR